MIIDETRNTARRMLRMNDRTFVIVMHADTMRARSIKERKLRDEAIARDETYWHESHGVPRAGRGMFFGGKSIVQRLLDAAGAGYDHLPDTGEERIAA